MPLFSRRRQISPDIRRYPASLHAAEGQVASVRKFDLTDRKDVAALLKTQQAWQQSAWYYFDEVGEMKDAVRFVENAFRRCRLFAGLQRDPDAEPIAVADAVPSPDDDDDVASEDEAGNDRGPLDYLTQAQADECDAILSSFAARDGGQAALLGKLGTNIFLVGEAYMVNRTTPVRRPNPGEDAAQIETGFDWEIRSRDEVRKPQNGDGVELIDTPDVAAGQGIQLTGADFIERVWRKHARYSGWADSNVRAAIGALEEVYLLNRLARSNTRSRILAGILTMPDELDFGDDDQPMDGEPGRKSVGFDRELEEAMAAVISSEEDANSVAPLILRGPADLLDAKVTRVIEFPRRYGSEEAGQYKEAIAKIGRAIELPLERLAGLEGINHWSAWLIDDDTYKAYIKPLLEICAEAILYGFLRPMLLQNGWDQDLVDRVVVAVDASKLVARPDRGKVATEGYTLDVPAISAEAWRKSNSFGDDDAPNDEEMQRHIAVKAGVDQVTAGRMLAELGLLPDDLTAQMQAAELPPTAPTGTPGENEPGVEPVPAGGEGGTPHGPPALAASGAPRRTVHTRLAAADRTLMARLQTAVDAAMNRAQEKAGARLRTLAMKTPSGRDILRSRDISNEECARTLGAATVAALTTGSVLFAGMFDHLRVQWNAWVEQAQQDALDESESSGTLSAFDRSTLTARFEQARDDAWAWLAAALLVASDQIAAGTQDRPPTGEQNPLLVVPPAIVREALARAGGAGDVIKGRSGALTLASGDPVGGVATGQIASDAFTAAGAPWVGYVWVHGDPKEPFEPHLQLDGVEITDWGDASLATSGDWPQVDGYFPGDHLWCTCSFTPISEFTAVEEEAA